MNKPIHITGCYRFKLTGDLWDSMSFTHKYNTLLYTKYRNELDELVPHYKKVITGLLRIEVVHYANKRFHGKSNIERRVELCPDSNYSQEGRFNKRKTRRIS